MTDNEMLEQLKSVIDDRKSFLSNDSELNEVFIKDIVALELIISKYKDLKLNSTIEILEEEKKIPERLTDILRVDDLIPPVDENMHKIWTQTIKNQNKINEIITYLESKGE